MNGRDSICKVIKYWEAATLHDRSLSSNQGVILKFLKKKICLQADLEEVSKLYIDAKSSAKILQEQQEKFISW